LMKQHEKNVPENHKVVVRVLQSMKPKQPANQQPIGPCH
jgi:hypothetical protein